MVTWIIYIFQSNVIGRMYFLALYMRLKLHMPSCPLTGAAPVGGQAFLDQDGPVQTEEQPQG